KIRWDGPGSDRPGTPPADSREIAWMFDHNVRDYLPATLHRWLVFAVTIGLNATGALLLAAYGEPSPTEIERFEKQIRPLLHEHCYECHSAEANVLQGGLRLDAASHLLAGGDSGPAVAPGNPDDSLLIQSVRYLGDGYDMPPAG